MLFACTDDAIVWQSDCKSRGVESDTKVLSAALTRASRTGQTGTASLSSNSPPTLPLLQSSGQTLRFFAEKWVQSCASLPSHTVIKTASCRRKRGGKKSLLSDEGPLMLAVAERAHTELSNTSVCILFIFFCFFTERIPNKLCPHRFFSLRVSEQTNLH